MFCVELLSLGGKIGLCGKPSQSHKIPKKNQRLRGDVSQDTMRLREGSPAAFVLFALTNVIHDTRLPVRSLNISDDDTLDHQLSKSNCPKVRGEQKKKKKRSKVGWTTLFLRFGSGLVVDSRNEVIALSSRSLFVEDLVGRSRAARAARSSSRCWQRPRRQAERDGGARRRCSYPHVRLLFAIRYFQHRPNSMPPLAVLNYLFPELFVNESHLF